ncbi:hypothetical protein DPMN_118075 [Dreissena polymorpha]|uniref:Uncharacterized protein n=2 Tax=Dreissena polymorpha TaxID=45954 RepID=A0A9D4JPW8_DREPO|nr:hypothetical protein DPMN_118075 [Dreissena polymorpha]
MIEIYEKNFIQFMAPLSQQDDFFVPEANENIPEEYSENQADISRDESMLDWTRDDVSRSSRDSSASSFSRSYVSSRYETDDLTDDESEDEGGPSVQDDEVSSTVDVRASKACTNLLEDAEKQAKLVTEEEILMTDDKDDLKLSADDSLNINNDSGVCSGRTSASPNESTNMGHVSAAAEADGNESSSSFEEIHVDSVNEAMSLSTEA